MPISGPFEHDSLIIPPDRRLLCTRYDGCLDQALLQPWASWRCGDCELYEKIDPQRQLWEMYALLILLCEVENPSEHRRHEDPE